MSDKSPHPTKNTAPPPSEKDASWLASALVIAYVAGVLAADTAAAWHLQWPWNWSALHMNPDELLRLGGANHIARAVAQTTFNQVDLFKWTFWFLIPLAVSLPNMDWGWLGIQKWKKLDLAILLAFVALAVAAVLIIPCFPSLREAYPSLKSLSKTQKWDIFFGKTLWTLSWLIGWEFLHRYFLLRHAAYRWPRFGWMLVPLSETLYHLQKPPLEALGMALFSIIASQWTLYRRNMALPFLVHFAIEIALWIFLLLI